MELDIYSPLNIDTNLSDATDEALLEAQEENELLRI